MTELLKKTNDADIVDDERQQYLTFLLGGEVFAIAILNIREIIEYRNITNVPMMPDFVRGVINLRGSVVPVIDLAMRFGREAAPVSRRTCIVLVEMNVEGETYNIGVTVDAVNAVLDIPNSDIEPAPAFGARIRSDFIGGMGKIDGKFVIILDSNKVLSVDEMTSLVKNEDIIKPESDND